LWCEKIKVPRDLYPASHNRQYLLNNPGEYPLPTDLTFRHYANHSIIAGGSEYFDPETVKEGDTIFLGDWFITWFVSYVHPKIKCKYILISSDTDGAHPSHGNLEYNEKIGDPAYIGAIR